MRSVNTLQTTASNTSVGWDAFNIFHFWRESDFKIEVRLKSLQFNNQRSWNLEVICGEVNKLSSCAARFCHNNLNAHLSYANIGNTIYSFLRFWSRWIFKKSFSLCQKHVLQFKFWSLTEGFFHCNFSAQVQCTSIGNTVASFLSVDLLQLFDWEYCFKESIGNASFMLHVSIKAIFWKTNRN